MTIITQHHFYSFPAFSGSRAEVIHSHRAPAPAALRRLRGAGSQLPGGFGSTHGSGRCSRGGGDIPAGRGGGGVQQTPQHPTGLGFHFIQCNLSRKGWGLLGFFFLCLLFWGIYFIFFRAKQRGKPVLLPSLCLAHGDGNFGELLFPAHSAGDPSQPR